MGHAKKKRIASMRRKAIRRARATREGYVRRGIDSVSRAAYVVAKILAGEF